jgi:hypothetical protein
MRNFSRESIKRDQTSRQSSKTNTTRSIDWLRGTRGQPTSFSNLIKARGILHIVDAGPTQDALLYRTCGQKKAHLEYGLTSGTSGTYLPARAGLTLSTNANAASRPFSCAAALESCTKSFSFPANFLNSPSSGSAWAKVLVSSSYALTRAFQFWQREKLQQRTQPPAFHLIRYLML